MNGPSSSPAEAASITSTLQKMIALLDRVPLQARPGFARDQLSRTSPHILTLFDSIPAEARSRSVLYVVPQPHSREARLATAARHAGWTPVLIHGREIATRCANAFPLRAGYAEIFDIVFASWAFPGPLVHSFTLSGDQALLLARLKPPHLILDFYDTCSGMAHMPAQAANAERCAMGYADGLVHRDLRMKLLQRLHGYPRARHNLFLYDPLPDEQLQCERIERPVADPIRVVSIGWIGKPNESIARIATFLGRAGIHVHAHLNGFEARVPDVVDRYRALEQAVPTFHLEPTLSGDAYWRALTRYDFGLSPNEPLLFGEPLVGLSHDYVAGCGSSRLVDYIRARLGVICSPELRFQHYWARRYAPVVVRATRQWLENPLPALLEARDLMRRRNPPSLGRITAQGSADRLGRFYQRVIGNA